MSLENFHRARRYARQHTGTTPMLPVLGVLAALTVPLLLIVVGLLISLLATGGDVRIPNALADDVATWAGEPDLRLDDSVVYENRGLLPVAVRLSQGHAAALGIGLYRHVPGWQRNGLALTTLVLLAVLLVGALSFLTVLLDRAVHRSAQRAASHLRWALNRQAFQLAASDVLRGPEADAVELFREKTDNVRHALVYWWRTLPRNVVMIAACVALALWIHVWLALAAVLLACGSWWIAMLIQRRPQHRKTLLSDRAALRMSLLIESLRQIRLARGLLMDDTPGEPFAAGLERYHREAVARDFADLVTRPLIWFLMAVSGGVYVWLSGVLALHEPPGVTLGEATTLAAALGCVVPALRQLARVRTVAERSDRAARAIFEYLDRHPSVGQIARPKELPPLREKISFTAVTLADRAGHKLLDEVSFTIRAGARTALLSSNPQTVKALVCLLPRFYDPAGGTVAFDGQDIREASLESLRRQVALVLQEDLLFTGTVAENIHCGQSHITASQVTEAARRVLAYDVIQSLPQGFETVIGNHGMRLQPHEVFLIGLARAVLRDPRVLVLEEPEGTLDTETDELLEQAIGRAAEGRTLIVLPTRLRTLREAKRILLFHEGKLHAEGTHNELLQHSELYRHLHYLRFNEFRTSMR